MGIEKQIYLNNSIFTHFMGRPLNKIFAKQVKFMVKNSGKMSFAEMSRRLGIDHQTCFYWRKKLEKRGIKVETNAQSQADTLLDKLYGKPVSGKNA